MTARASAKAGYHHGDLRRALLDASLSLIERHGPEGFTLRAAAREAGVTAGAPYHHFEDKDALIGALADEGFELFYGALASAAAEPAESMRERTDNMAIAYVRFAVEHPTRFRLMTGRDVGRVLGKRGHAQAHDAYALMRQAVISKVTGTGSGKIAEEIILCSWALVHGLAFLAIDGHLTPEGTSWKHCGPIVRRLLRHSLGNPATAPKP